ncbi:MAG TPA: hypothetical protein VFA26_07215 [Gemmataceae bacterium]|nr:hypothetical protein [Gemmataceae bacterium]
MDLRITSQFRTQQAIANARRATDQLGKLEEQMGTGNRLLAPSDDPLGQVAVLSDSAQVGRIDTYLSNVHAARATLNTSVTALRNASDLLSQAKQIAIEGSASPNDANAYEALASQVDGLLSHLLDLANSQGPDGQYLYGGAAAGAAPFAVTARNAQGLPQAVAYSGSAQGVQTAVSAQQRVATLYPGGGVFQAPPGPSAPAGADAFQALVNLRDDLRNTRHLPADQQIASISSRIGEIDAAQGTVLGVVGEQSASLQNLDAVEQRLQDFQLNARERVSNTQGADISTVLINFQSQQNLLRMTLAATAQINQVSLLDFLH